MKIADRQGCARKAGTSAHWAMYEIAYGAPDGEYIALSSDKSMADIDTGFAEDNKFQAALGEHGMKELRRTLCGYGGILTLRAIFHQPKMSYVPDEWIKADGDFWKPKPAAAPPAKPPRLRRNRRLVL